MQNNIFCSLCYNKIFRIIVQIFRFMYVINNPSITPKIVLEFNEQRSVDSNQIKVMLSFMHNVMQRCTWFYSTFLSTTIYPLLFYHYLLSTTIFSTSLSTKKFKRGKNTRKDNGMCTGSV